MTNDGELSQHVMHPKYEVEKTYIATIEGKIGGTVCRRLVTHGVQLDDGLDQARPLRDHRRQPRPDHRQGGAPLRQEPYRPPHLRRHRLPGRRLVRTQIGPIKLGDFKSGSYRVLSQVGGPFAVQGGRSVIRVAIDGPAGVGKSSTSKALANYFGFAYLDTGAMYRACAWWCLKQGIDLDANRG